MSCRFLFRCLALAVAAGTLPLSAAPVSPHEHLSLDANWKFHLGDDWPNALYLNKAGVNKGPAGASFDDAAWRTVNLPHDWAVELPFDPAADVGHGFKPVGPGFPATSVGWYRRTLDLPETDSGKRIWLQFDGAFRDTTLYVNGWFVGHYESGYYPFRADITDLVRFGKKNTIAARVDASRFEGWFYEGAGIYRHVWLDKTEPVAIAGDGIFVYSKFPGNVPEGAAELHAEVRLSNALDKPVEASIVHAFFDPNGAPVGEMKQTAKLAPLSQETFSTDGVEPASRPGQIRTLVAGIAEALQAGHDRVGRRESRGSPGDRVRHPDDSPSTRTRDFSSTASTTRSAAPAIIRITPESARPCRTRCNIFAWRSSRNSATRIARRTIRRRRSCSMRATGSACW